MKKNKKVFWLLLGTISIAILVAASFLIYNIYNDDTAISLKEEKWIDANKNNVIDITVLNDIPVVSYDGNGLVFDFFDYLENATGLKLNKSANKVDNQKNASYSIKIADSVSQNDLLLLTDNYILVNNSGIVYDNLNQPRNLKVGILSEDAEYFNNYFKNLNLEFVAFDTYSALMHAMSVIETETSDEETEAIANENGVDAILILKNLYMKDIAQNNNITIAYEYNDLTKNIVLSLNGEDILNSIFKKIYRKWYDSNYQKAYNKYLLQQYYIFNDVKDSQQRIIKSKKYTYGFVETGIYDYMDGDEYKGFNNVILKNFVDFAGVSVNYKKYKSIDSLIRGFNNNEVDLILNNVDYDTSNNYLTNDVIKDNVFVISNYSNNVNIKSISSLKGLTVSTVKNSRLEKLLLENDINVKSYANLKQLSKNFGKNDIVLIEKENYIYYKDKYFVNTKIDCVLDDTISYGYLLSNADSSRYFNDLLNFFVTFSSLNSIISDNYNFIAAITKNYYLILGMLVVLLGLVVLLSVVKRTKILLIKYRESRRLNLTKEEKIKYIDQLTLLKNRAYYNSRVEKWNESTIYPQGIVVIDLNNIAYINDNYGFEEGDKVITEAANILIQSQMPNTEIIRTDGNEFLIYMIGYDERHVVAYLRKLIKAMKRLSHGFGAAGGYSLITDDVKTIDDAVNEATNLMKTNKEDIDY